MQIININGNDKKVEAVESNIKEMVIIPEELKSNMKWSTTSLGGLFLEYWSNRKLNSYKENSKVYIQMHINIGNGFGQYVGEVGTVNVMRKYNLKMTNIKKETDVKKIIQKLNKWINENKTTMVEAIEM